MRLDPFVRHEEESGARSGADESGTDAGVNSTEAARRVEAIGGLEPGF